jgi:uncharacterized membrane protein
MAFKMSPASVNQKSVSGGKTAWKVMAILGVTVLLMCIVSYFLLGKGIATTLRVILGLVYLLFLPGYLLCWLVFPNNSDIDSVERIGLGFGLSIPLTLTWVLVLDKVFNVPLSGMNIVLGLGVLLCAFLILGFVQQVISRRKILKK